MTQEMNNRNLNATYCLAIVVALAITPCTTLGRAITIAQSIEKTSGFEDDPLESALDLWDSEPIDTLDDSVDLLFEDFGVVITASRMEQASNLTSVPVSIFSESDIHYSGVHELPQLLSFIPGMDAIQLDRNRWALGVRGLHQTFSDRTLFLLNGQIASNPVHGGVDFQRLPIFLDDIKQIETVRGPGGAAWGANAFNGVVNVIEKSPRETVGTKLSQRISEQGDSKTNFRIGRANEKFAWRLSGQYNDVEATDTSYVVIGPVVAPSNPKDFLRSQKYDFDAVYDWNDDTSLEFGIGGTHLERGDSPFLVLQLNIDERIDLIRSHAKLSHTFSPDSSGYVQWYGTYQDVNRPSMYRYNAYDNNFESQYNFSPNENHDLTIGATLRLINLDITQPRETDSLPEGTSSEQWAGAFINDQWTIDQAWNLETQLRIDWYSETELDWSGRIALLHSIDSNSNHMIRFALAKAFRTPQTALRDLDSDRNPVGGGLFAVNLIPAEEIDNEQLYSIELGYAGKLREGLTFRSDAYLQYYQDLTGAINLPEPAPVLGRNFFTIDNIGSAEAFGVESELKYQIEQASFSIWYAYHDFKFETNVQNARAFRPSKHKIGANARFNLTDWLTANFNYRYTDTTYGSTTLPTEAFHRLDVTATIGKPEWNAEIQFGILDLLDQTGILVFDQTATNIAQRTPGQSFFVQLHYSF